MAPNRFVLTFILAFEGVCVASNCTLRSYSGSNYRFLTSNCSSNGIVLYNTKCSFECDDSSILRGRRLLTCGANNTFDYPIPTCRGKNSYAVVYSSTADVGDNVVMPCGISDPAEDEYNVYWYKSGTKRTPLLHKTSTGFRTTYSHRGYQINNGIDLLIPTVTKGDSGMYQCDVVSHGSNHMYTYNISLLVRGTCKIPALAGALHTNTTACGSEATIVEGSSCHYYCQSRFGLVGQHSTRCLENGSLSERIPSCRPKEELNGFQPRNSRWITLIIVTLLIVGAIVLFSFWKLRKEKMGNYSAVSKHDKLMEVTCRAPNPPQQGFHIHAPVTSHAMIPYKGYSIDGKYVANG